MPGGFPLGLELCNGNDQGIDTANSRGTAVVAGSGSYGSYVQLVASTPSDTCWMELSIVTDGTANFGNVGVVNIAVGAAASEVVVAADLSCHYGSSGKGCSAPYLFPISIPAGSRVSVAVKQAATTDTYWLSVRLYDGAFTQLEGCAGVESNGNSSAHGTSLVAGAANVKGSYSQITASTPRDYIGIMWAVDANGLAGGQPGPQLLDIAIGAGGSEVIIVPNWQCVWSNNVVIPNVGGFLPVPIPAGTRIAARIQNVSGSGNNGLTVYGVYQ